MLKILNKIDNQFKENVEQQLFYKKKNRLNFFNKIFSLKAIKKAGGFNLLKIIFKFILNELKKAKKTSFNLQFLFN